MGGIEPPSVRRQAILTCQAVLYQLSYIVLFIFRPFRCKNHSSIPRPVLICYHSVHLPRADTLNPLPVIFGISTGRYFLPRARPTVSLITASASSVWPDRVMQWIIQTCQGTLLCLREWQDSNLHQFGHDRAPLHHILSVFALANCEFH